MMRYFYIFASVLLLTGCRFFGANSTFYPNLVFSQASPFAYAQTYLRTSTDQSFEITNVGDLEATDLTAALSSSNFIFKGGTYPGTGGTCGTSLGIKNSCLIVVSFTPQASGTLSDELVLSYKPAPLFGSQTVSISLQGEGLPVAFLSISDGSIYNYGRVVINTNSDKTFTLTNSGGGAATAIAVATSPTTPFSFPSSFPGGGTCTSTLAAGASCTFIIRYSPVAFTNPSDSVTLSYHDGGSTNTVSRSYMGTGVGRPGSFDTTFGTKGIVTNSMGSSYDSLFGSFLDTNGKMTFIGSLSTRSGNGGFSVVRVDSNFTFDTSFATSGVITSRCGSIMQSCQTFYSTATYDLSTKKLFAWDGANYLLVDLDGIMTTSGGAPASYSGPIGIQTDGKILPVTHIGVRYEGWSIGRLFSSLVLDTTFYTTGTAFFDPTVSGLDLGGYPYAIISNDFGSGNKITIAGSADYDFGLVRLNSDGSFDTSFDTDGKLMQTIGTGTNPSATPFQSNIYDLMVTTAGELVGVGPVAYYNGSANVNVIGVFIDTGGGKYAGMFGTGNQTPQAVTYDRNGNIVLAGYQTVSGENSLLISRISIGGLAFDNGFGTNGIATTTFRSGNSAGVKVHCNKCVIPTAPDVFTVSGYGIGEIGRDYAFARFLTNGILDTSFNTNGKKTINLLDIGDNQITDIVVDTSGKTWGFAAVYEGGNYAAGVVRYDSLGNLDSSFHTDGLVSHSFGTAALSNGIKGIVRSNGEVLLAGLIATTGKVLALNPDGTLNTSFNTSGYSVGLTTAGSVKAILEQADGKVVVGGATASDFWIARVTTNGKLDPTFNTTGIAVYNKGSSEAINHLSLDGTKIMAGGFSVGTNADFAILRILSDGVLDTSFSTTGILTVSVQSEADSAFSILITSDGRYIAAGDTYKGKDIAAVIRVLSNGGLDTSFNTAGISFQSVSTNALDTTFGARAVLETNGQVAVAFGYGGIKNFSVLRVGSSGLLDTTFGNKGYLTASFLGNAVTGNGVFSAMSRSSDGTLRVGGGGYRTNNTATERVFQIIKIWP